jgi:hypothetical protein
VADIAIGRDRLPFVLGGTSAFTVKTGAADIDKPLPRGVHSVLDIDLHASADAPVTLGGAGSWTLGVKAGTTIQLATIWQTDGALVRKYGLGSYFDANRDGLILLLTVGARADGNFAGTFRYGMLEPGAQFEAGSDLSFVFAAPVNPASPIKIVIPDFFSRVHLPATTTAAPAPGELLHFEYGGYLRLGGSVGVGYEIKGTPSIALDQVRLAEHYQLSVIGTLGVTAEVGGFFGIDIRPDVDERGQPRPGWARVIVNRTRTSEFSFAADVSVKAKTRPQKMPATPPEFLGALVGVNLKNWLNLLQHVDHLTDFNQLASELDDLGITFLTTWFGKTVTGRNLPELLKKVKQVVTEYDQFDASVLSVVDHAFDKISGPGLGTEIGDALQHLAGLSSWDELKGSVNPTLWSLVNQLTDGDPLGWMAEKAVSELQKRAQAVLSLGRGAAASELTAFIRFAKGEFGFDALANELRAIDTPARLQTELKKRAGAFLQRLLGPEIKTLSQSDLGEVFGRIHPLLAQIDAFEQTAYDALSDALTQSLSFDLHADYSRASDAEALLDVAIKATTSDGRALLQAAALGDFTQTLAGYRPDLVRINQATLTSNLIRTKALTVNVLGWHDGWHYKSVEQLILHADQQFVPNDAGGLCVFSTIDLTRTTEQDRQRGRDKAKDQVRTMFLLRFLGESHGVLAGDPASQQYLIETITQMTASYALSFDDNHTTATDLAYYLGFAADFGLAAAGVTLQAVAALLPRQAVNDYGHVTAQYDVRYTDEGLQRLFRQLPDERTMRRIMRQIVLASYLARGGPLGHEGWVYWTADVYRQWKQAPQAFAERRDLTYEPIDRSPFPETRPAPPRILLPADRHPFLAALYRIEDRFVRTFQILAGLIAAGQPLSPGAFKTALGDIGGVLSDVDRFGESVNASFALFDALLLEAGAHRASSLALTSMVPGRKVKKVFVAS